MRLTGRLQPANKRTTAFNSVLQTLGYAEECSQAAATEAKRIHLRADDVNAISTHPQHVNRVAMAFNKIKIKRQGRDMTLTTQDHDIGKPTSGHIVCWTNLDQYVKNQDVSDLDEAKFGIVTRILKVKVQNQENPFVKLKVFKTVCYQKSIFIIQ